MKYPSRNNSSGLPVQYPCSLFPRLLFPFLLFPFTAAFPQTSPSGSSVKEPPGIGSIRQEEIRTDLFNMASDHFRGREAGTPDELKVSAWLAEQARRAGLAPAGDDGTYFQFFPVWRNRISPASSIHIGETGFPLWKESLLPFTAPASVNAEILFIDRADTSRADIRGKAIALKASPEGINMDVSLPARRYPTLLYRKYAARLIDKGAAAVIFIADSLAGAGWSLNAAYFDHGIYDIAGGPNENTVPREPVIFLPGTALHLVQQSGMTLHADIRVEKFESVSVNVAGVQQGSDPHLKGEFVLFSGHQDHDGIRLTGASDSIYNGADDNASMSVALLAIARAFHHHPGSRSALFIWHGAEERGLLGSRWYAAHPTVPASDIVAVLNGDMIGRNAPDSAALLGVRPPHRNSAGLVAEALAANAEGPRFKLDTLYDQPSHIEAWYFRSDHLPYARAGIPALFFTSLLHPDYHTPKDEAARIDLTKLTKMTQWIYRTGWKLANNISRPQTDPGFRLER